MGVVCKRVIGLPGDVITPPHSSHHNQQHWGSASITVPEGHVWIEGDNPQDSRDSR